MKKGWQTKKLADVCNVKHGFAFDGVEFSGDVPEGNPVVITPGNFTEDGRLLFNKKNTKRFSGKPPEEFRFDIGDLVVVMTDLSSKMKILGKPAFVETDDVLHNQRIGRVMFLNGGIEKRFVYYFMMSDGYLQSIKISATGTMVKHTAPKRILDNEILLPPLAEQQRIVGILDEAFEGIATAKANAEKNLQNARALFESHLQSVFTQRGEGWVQKTLEEIATTFGRGKSRHRPRNSPHLYGGPYPFVQTGDIRNADHVITEYSQTYSEAGLAQSRLWPKGTICITIAANIAETAILDFDACFPDSVIGVVANQKQADVGFIEYLLQSFKARLQGMGKGSAQANINMGTFENERFPFPSVAEQQTIVAKLDGLSEETQTLATIYERKLAALDDLKKSLLHQAFSGEL